MKMKVTRPFILAGERQEIGTEFETDDRGLIAMLKTEGKAIALAPSDPTGPMTTETTSGVVAGGKGKAAKPAAPKAQEE